MKFGNKMLKPECYWLRLHCGQQSHSVTWTTITCLVTLDAIKNEWSLITGNNIGGKFKWEIKKVILEKESIYLSL